MPDVFTKAKRSLVMAAIRGRGNRTTELRLMALYRAHGITGWRRGSRLPGRPDFVFPKHRVAVFVDGCFWHGCPVHGAKPRSNAEFWSAKISGNRLRDRKVSRQLVAKGWKVLRVWEHSLGRARQTALLVRIRAALAGGS